MVWSSFLSSVLTLPRHWLTRTCSRRTLRFTLRSQRVPAPHMLLLLLLESIWTSLLDNWLVLTRILVLDRSLSRYLWTILRNNDALMLLSRMRMVLIRVLPTWGLRRHLALAMVLSMRRMMRMTGCSL